MRAAKIISLISILLFGYLSFYPSAGLRPLVSILNQAGSDVSLVVILSKLVPIIALLVNIGFSVLLFVKSDAKKELKRATFIACLLLVIPLAVMYLSYAFVMYKIFNLSSTV